MPSIKFTARTAATLKPAGDRVDYFDTVVRGLALRITATGKKTWTVHYRTAARRLRRLTLGQYPTLSLGRARKAAGKALLAAVNGEDPATEKQTARAGETVKELAREYLDRYAKVHKRSWREDERMLDVDVLPAWRSRKVKELTRRDVRALIEAKVDAGAPIAANRVLALVRKMLNFAVQRDWIDANPAALIPKPGAERSRDRVLTAAEIRLVWAACAEERPALCALLRLRLLTAQRGGELAQLRWLEDVDLESGWITLPATVTKNKQPHRVPLSPPAVAILAALPRVNDWVFPGQSEKKPLSDMKKGGQRIARRVLLVLQQIDPMISTFDFRGHDLRRTASTEMAEAGITQADIARVLNHAEGGPRATAVYNRYAYDREKRIALETWSRRLTAILEASPAGTVVPFARLM